MASRPQRRAESDVQQDNQVISDPPVGGVENPEHPDQHSTTGTTPNSEFVGRAAGEDVGYLEETGAERRARVHEEHEEAADEASSSTEDSFPASDPPGSY